MTPEMHIRLQTIQFSGLMRLALEPLLPDLPFIGGCSISFLSMPELDFDIRYLKSGAGVWPPESSLQNTKGCEALC